MKADGNINTLSVRYVIPVKPLLFLEYSDVIHKGIRNELKPIFDRTIIVSLMKGNSRLSLKCLSTLLEPIYKEVTSPVCVFVL